MPWYLQIAITAVLFVISRVFIDLIESHLTAAVTTYLTLFVILSRLTIIGFVYVVRKVLKIQQVNNTSDENPNKLMWLLNYFLNYFTTSLVLSWFFSSTTTVLLFLARFNYQNISRRVKKVIRKFCRYVRWWLCGKSQEEEIGKKLFSFFDEIFRVLNRVPEASDFLKFRLRNIEKSTTRLGSKHAHECFNYETFFGIFRETSILLNEKAMSSQENDPSLAEICNKSVNELADILDLVFVLRANEFTFR